MYWFLLRKALPFTLTFIFGALLSALVGLFGSSKTSYELVRVQQHVGEFGRGRRECRTRRSERPEALEPGIDQDRPVVGA